MKLWDKGFETEKNIEKFTVGQDRELDLKLAKHDVKGSLAHAKMLNHIGILSDAEMHDISTALEKIAQNIDDGNFVIGEAFEDVHSRIEYELVEDIGEAGKKIHTARSRNDQVLVDLCLYFKEEIEQMIQLVGVLFDTLMSKAKEHEDILMPGYTHLQIAMPSSFGLWFSAYAESLIDDLSMLRTALTIADQNPLGSAAGYGTSFPIDRNMTTQLLGFKTMKHNVIASQMSRGKMEKAVAFAIASVSGTLSKLAMDVCLYMSQNFNFFSLPKSLTTGSSIMPHKQNPDVFELIRAKCNVIQNLPQEIILVTNNLPSGYHRDYQVLKESVIPAIDQMKDILEITNYAVKNLKANEDILDDPMYDHLFTVEEVNRLVISGVPFRDAYREVGQRVIDGDYRASRDIHHTHEGSIGNLCLDEIRLKFERASATS